MLPQFLFFASIAFSLVAWGIVTAHTSGRRSAFGHVLKRLLSIPTAPTRFRLRSRG